MFNPGFKGKMRNSLLVGTAITLAAAASVIAIGSFALENRDRLAQNRGNFEVRNSKIYAPDGSEFLIKGTNINGPDYGWPGNTPSYVDLVADCWNFNTVRVNVRLLGGQISYDENGTIEEIIDIYTGRGLVTMVEAHDHTGSYYEGEDLETLKDFYRDLATTYKNNPYVWFNIMNEPGGHESSANIDKWLKVHQEVIQVIRDEVGADNMIVIDGHYWGQDVGEWNSKSVSSEKSAILGPSQKLINFNGKPYDNLVFSVHFYDQWKFSQTKMADYLDRAAAKNIPLIIGEYGIEKNAEFKSPVDFMFNTAVPRNIGRIVWAWWGGDNFELTTTDNGGGHHIDSCENPTNLTWLGEQVWKDNHGEYPRN